MIKIIKSLLILLFLASFSFQAYSETSWITKKDKTKKTLVKKTETKEKNNEWIKKKKKEKEKKVIEKVKEKIKESKSWITKKSKKEKKIIKKELKKYYDVNSLPKADLYFAAKIFPKDENEEFEYLYGYVNSEKKSTAFQYKNTSYHESSNGVAYYESKKISCEMNRIAYVKNNKMKGDVILECSNKLTITGEFTQKIKIGKGDGETTKANEVEFEFYSSKNDAIAKLELYKEDTKTLITRSLPAPRNNKNIKLEPNGKYYALLIGNSEYTNWENLVSPKNDIREIKKVLDKSYKFEKILTVNNGTKKEIFKAFRDLSKLTTENDYVLIYYSGHGMEKAEQAYWIPKDGSKEWGNGDWININELNIFLTEIKAHHLSLMVDSCYVGGKFKGTNILDLTNEEDRTLYGKNLEDGLNLRARSVLSSGSKGRVSDTVGKTKHSLFALAFLNVLKISEQNSVPLNMLNVAIRVRSAYAGNYTQKPIYYHPDTWQDGGGDFIFIPKKNLL
ncbi:caspase family protein [Candidatus Pelagibacter sp.]|nr:caspase family protein [Candidatus Pelagibacter sp.]